MYIIKQSILILCYLFCIKRLRYDFLARHNLTGRDEPCISQTPRTSRTVGILVLARREAINNSFSHVSRQGQNEKSTDKRRESFLFFVFLLFRLHTLFGRVCIFAVFSNRSSFEWIYSISVVNNCRKEC